MKIKFIILLILLLTTSKAHSAFQAESPDMSLKETFDLYVWAVQNSDLEALFRTITENNDFLFLNHSGKLITSREEYYSFHAEWFKEPEWEMPVDHIQIHQNGESGYVNAVFHYKSKSIDGKWFHLDSWFTLIFQKENGQWKAVADICTPIHRWTSNTKNGPKYSSNQQFLFSMLKNRRTVRRFKSKPVPREHIMKILDAARFAPTAGNQQPWKFLVINDRKRLNRLKAAASSWYTDNPQKKEKIQQVLEEVLSAPVYVAVLVDKNCPYPDYNIYDGTLAAGNLMTAARALGYGTGFFTTFFPEEQMKNFFRIPDRYRLICFTPIGIPENWPDTPDKKSLDKLVVFEKF